MGAVRNALLLDALDRLSAEAPENGLCPVTFSAIKHEVESLIAENSKLLLYLRFYAKCDVCRHRGWNNAEDRERCFKCLIEYNAPSWEYNGADESGTEE